MHACAWRVEPLEGRRLLSASAGTSALEAAAAVAPPPRVVENLDRGVVAVRSTTSQAFVSWRLLGLDPAGVGFNVYRSANGGAPVKLNGSPLMGGTNFTDATANFSQSNRYHVRAVIGGVEGAASVASVIAANAPVGQFLSIPLQVPAGGTTPDGVNYTYSANDTSVGDLDGDGDYEFIVKWDPSNSKDNSQSGYTGNVYVDAYTLEGTRLWRIDLGRNIRAGAHYTQFIVYDLDSDGRAEIAMKTADGTIDGAGVVIGNPAADFRNSSGYILTGPEFLTVFNGQTGAAMATTNYIVPRGTVSSWGDSYGNRVDRFLAGVAYLDGQRPSLIVSRGYYTRAVIVAWDWRNGQLTQRWTFDSEVGGNTAYRGQGAHSLSIADVDADGRDEIIFGAATIDDNGRGLYSTGLGHGDALHVSDMDPSRPGQEVFMVHEDTGGNGHIGGSLRDARTGEIIVGLPVVQDANGDWPDVGRGVAMDVHPTPGYEFWDISHPSIYNVNGTAIHSRGNAFINFGAWWDGDLFRELLDGTTISKWQIPNGGRVNFDLDPGSSSTFPPGVSSNNGTKSNPALSGDIFGDWREEVIWRRSDSTALHVYTTTIPTTTRLVTLMHDTQYRAAIAWQNVAYNQPPHPSFFLGDGMSQPPAPNVRYAGLPFDPPPGPVYPAEYAQWGGGTTMDNNNAGYNDTGFANFATAGGFVEFTGVDGGAHGDSGAALAFRYANGTTSSRAGTITINGVTQPISFAPTGGWTTWQTLTITSALSPGKTNVIRLNSTGQDLGNVDELLVTLTPPIVTGVFVSGTAWSGGFLSHLQSSGLGESAFGYRINPADAPDELPWTNLNKLSVRFNEAVDAGLLDLVIRGVNNLAYATSAVAYDAATFTATWTLATTGLGPEKLLLALSADGAAGAEHLIRLNMLPGDVNRSGGSVVGSDVTLVRNAQNAPPGSALYTIFKDVNGSGSILGSDVTLVRNRQGSVLPAGEPLEPSEEEFLAALPG